LYAVLLLRLGTIYPNQVIEFLDFVDFVVDDSLEFLNLPDVVRLVHMGLLIAQQNVGLHGGRLSLSSVGL